MVRNEWEDVNMDWYEKQDGNMDGYKRKDA